MTLNEKIALLALAGCTLHKYPDSKESWIIRGRTTPLARYGRSNGLRGKHWYWSGMAWVSQALYEEYSWQFRAAHRLINELPIQFVQQLIEQ